MKTGKIILALFLVLAIGQKSFSQAPGHEEPSFPDKSTFVDRKDPVKSMQFFPNPATDYLTLKLESPQARKVKLSVFTIIGNTVDVESEVVDDFEIRIKVRDLSSGYYLLAMHNPETNAKHTYKFLKR